MHKSLIFLVAFATLSLDFVDAQTITSQLRRVRVETRARDAIFDEDDVIRNDRSVFRGTGFWTESIGVNSSTISGNTSADAFQLGAVNASENSFQLDGMAETWSIEDGSSRSKAESFVRINFNMPQQGTVVFDQIFLEAFRPQINDDPRDDDFERSDTAILFVRIFDVESGLRVFNQTLRLNPAETYKDFDNNVDVDLGAGNYRLDIRARVVGSDNLNVVQGQPRAAVAYFFVEGFIE